MEKKLLKDVRDRMADLKSKRDAELRMVKAKREEARAAAEKAENELTAAMETMDAERYVAASQEKQKAHAELEMYTRHFDHLSKQELISEAESDAVIDDLLAYERELDANIHDAIAGPLQRIEKMIREYRSEISQVEETLAEWQHEIHANHRSFGMSHYRDADGNLTKETNYNTEGLQ